MTTFADVRAAMEEYKAARDAWQKACVVYLRESGWIQHFDGDAWHHDTHIVEDHYWVDTLEAVADQYAWECKRDGVEI